MSELSPAEIEAQVRAHLWRYRTHSEWPDILQEARLAAWKALGRADLRQRAAPGTIIGRAAEWAAAEYLRSPRAAAPGRRGARRPVPEQLDEERAPRPEGQPEPPRPLWAHAELLAGVPPRVRRLFLAHYRDGVTQAQLAVDEGISFSRVWQLIESGRATLRAALGVPKPAPTECVQCAAPILNRRPGARYCSRRCKGTAADRRRGHLPRRPRAEAAE